MDKHLLFKQNVEIKISAHDSDECDKMLYVRISFENNEYKKGRDYLRIGLDANVDTLKGDLLYKEIKRMLNASINSYLLCKLFDTSDDTIKKIIEYDDMSAEEKKSYKDMYKVVKNY